MLTVWRLKRNISKQEDKNCMTNTRVYNTVILGSRTIFVFCLFLIFMVSFIKDYVSFCSLLRTPDDLILYLVIFNNNIIINMQPYTSLELFNIFNFF